MAEHLCRRRFNLLLSSSLILLPLSVSKAAEPDCSRESVTKEFASADGGKWSATVEPDGLFYRAQYTFIPKSGFDPKSVKAIDFSATHTLEGSIMHGMHVELISRLEDDLLLCRGPVCNDRKTKLLVDPSAYAPGNTRYFIDLQLEMNNDSRLKTAFSERQDISLLIYRPQEVTPIVDLRIVGLELAAVQQFCESELARLTKNFVESGCKAKIEQEINDEEACILSYECE